MIILWALHDFIVRNFQECWSRRYPNQLWSDPKLTTKGSFRPDFLCWGFLNVQWGCTIFNSIRKWPNHLIIQRICLILCHNHKSFGICHLGHLGNDKCQMIYLIICRKIIGQFLIVESRDLWKILSEQFFKFFFS
jgi:hypothetical protein